MDKIGINGISLTSLKIITNDQGSIFHGLKKSESDFSGFGEAYFSTVGKNIIKGWNRHKDMIINLIVCVGEVKFVIYDDRNNSRSKGNLFTCTLSSDNYMRLKVNNGLWVAFKGISKNNTILNIGSLEHHPEELEKLPIHSFKYNW